MSIINRIFEQTNAVFEIKKILLDVRLKIRVLHQWEYVSYDVKRKRNGLYERLTTNNQ